MKAALFNLSLVFTPFTNQEGEWFWEDGEVKDIARASNIYFLAQRKELLFKNVIMNYRKKCIQFDLSCGSNRAKNIELPISRLIDDEIFKGPIKIECGSRLIRGRKENGEVIFWFTPDKLIYEYSCNEVEINNFKNAEPFTTFDLYYVGISKKGDSFSRLFKNGHRSRMKILSNEKQKVKTARLTDEIYVFLFQIQSTLINTIDTVSDFEWGKKGINKKKVIADAEKAFVKILKSKYNIVDYRKYPNSQDGLFNEKLDRYCFVLNEDIIFRTSRETIIGRKNMFENPDFIAIDSNQVTLIKTKIKSGAGRYIAKKILGTATNNVG